MTANTRSAYWPEKVEQRTPRCNVAWLLVGWQPGRQARSKGIICLVAPRGRLETVNGPPPPLPPLALACVIGRLVLRSLVGASVRCRRRRRRRGRRRLLGEPRWGGIDDTAPSNDVVFPLASTH